MGLKKLDGLKGLANRFLEPSKNSGNSKYNSMPEASEVMGHELGNKVSKLAMYERNGEIEIWEGYEELLSRFNDYRQNGSNSESGFEDLIVFADSVNVPDSNEELFDDVIASVRAFESYKSLFKGKEEGKVALGDFMTSYGLDSYDSSFEEGEVVGGMYHWIWQNTMKRNSRTHTDLETKELDKSIEVEETQSSYVIIYTDNGSPIEESVREKMYGDKSDTGLGMSAELIRMSGGEIEYYEENGRKGHKVTLPRHSRDPVINKGAAVNQKLSELFS